MVLLNTEIDESSVTLDAQSDLEVLQTGIRLVRALGPVDELEARIATLALEHLKKIRRLGGKHRKPLAIARLDQNKIGRDIEEALDEAGDLIETLERRRWSAPEGIPEE